METFILYIYLYFLKVKKMQYISIGLFMQKLIDCEFKMWIETH